MISMDCIGLFICFTNNLSLFLKMICTLRPALKKDIVGGEPVWLCKSFPFEFLIIFHLFNEYFDYVNYRTSQRLQIFHSPKKQVFYLLIHR